MQPSAKGTWREARVTTTRATPPDGPVDAAHPLVGIRVLLVDDDDDIREAFAMLLEDHGAEVRPAASAAAALTMLEHWTPDVLLTDVSMPGQTGDQLMHQVAARLGAPPAAAITANATSDGRTRALAAGFKLYLGKPIDSRELVAAVAALAGRTLPDDPTAAAGHRRPV
jgi:CheY-like chemotaxis protein